MPDHDSADMIGKAFGRYRIQERLGEGGMGSVWKAEDTLLHRVVALKFLSAELVDSPEARQRFLREARSASVLEHPGIATVFDAGEVDGTPYLAVQFVEGMTLSERIRQGPIPVPEAVEIHRQAAEALAHAHSRSVLHRDISSRNLMLKPDGSVVLVDFGLAKRSDMTQLTRTGTTQGTIAYLAPEVLEGAPATEASDCYSLGVVLYEMVTGELPFRGERVEAVMLKIMTEDPEPPSLLKSDVPSEVDRVVLRLLAKAPEARGEGEAVGAIPVPTSPRRTTYEVETAPRRFKTQRPWYRSRWSVALLAGVLLVCVTAVIVLLNPSTPLSRPRSIAVMPLTNRSANLEESDYLAETISDFLSRRLAEIEDLHVIPWTSSRNLGDVPNPADAARRLNVEALLTGGVRVENGQVRLELTLVDGKNGRTAWSQEFTSRVSQVQEVQSAAILAVLERIHEPLSEEARRRAARATSESADAYEIYQQGVHCLRTNTKDTNEEAMQLFSRAIDLDTSYADAYSGLGGVLMNRFYQEWGGGADLIAQARRNFEMAFALEPSSVSARRGLADVFAATLDSSDNADVVRIGRELLALNPSSIEHRLAAGIAFQYAGLSKAAAHLFRGVLLDDPNSLEARWLLVPALGGNGEVDECLRACREYEALAAEDPEILTWKSLCLASKEDVEQAIAVMERSVDLFDDGRRFRVALDLAALLNRLGRDEEARGIASSVLVSTGPRLISYPDHWETMTTHSQALAFLGMSKEYDRAMAPLLIGSSRWYGPDRSIDMLALGRNSEAEEMLCMSEMANHTQGTFFWIYLSACYPEFLERPNVEECVKRLFEQQHARSDEVLREFNIAGS